jgi:cholesterol transport system auxiliary component
LAVLAAASVSLVLAGCVNVFPKATPAQLYAFGQAAPQPAEPTGPQVNVLRAATVFAPAAAGDRILTANGQEAAYIGGSRWVSPAAVLFDQAELRAFQASSGPARLVQHGELVSAQAQLRLQVETFEARYPGARDKPPTVVVRVRANLSGLGDRTTLLARTFESQQRAGANRVGEIVRSFDVATADVLGQIVAWTNQQVTASPVRS